MNQYSQLKGEALSEHLSNYLVNSWSYSSVTLFGRNELWFAKEIIYCEKSRRSAGSIAGNAYHSALQYYFECRRQDYPEPTLIDLENEAYAYIERVPANDWRQTKTLPTIEEAIAHATKVVTTLLENFYAEKDLYTEDIEEILGIELRLAPPEKGTRLKDNSQWVSLNGVDIPLPCHAVIDLIVRLKDGKVVIIDHKSKSTYTDEQSISLVHGKQAITYTLAYESYSGETVSEVWFVENKIAKNKDASPQMRKFVIVMDEPARQLYEALLYEPLKKMIDAISDPDYIYLPNDSDSLVDKAEMYDFWARTRMNDISSFPEVPVDKRQKIADKLKRIQLESAHIKPTVIQEFKERADAFIPFDYSMTDMTNPEKIEHVLKTFGVVTKVAKEIEGYSSNTYLLEVSQGVNLKAISKYNLNIASALDVANVRIPSSLVVHDGRSYLAIEANHKRTKDLLWDGDALEGRRLPIGRDNYGNLVVWDLDNHSTPHLLVCGATGSGKSVCILSTIKYAMKAGISDIYVFDPKYEFTALSSLGVKVYNDIDEIESTMASLELNMQLRTDGTAERHMTLLVFDEFADALMQSSKGKALDIKDDNGRIIGRAKSLEENLRMLLQKGRSLGFRVMAATQRASVKVITGDTKVNFPARVCFRVPSEIDSKVVLDETGAEMLAGMGDGLMRSPEYMDKLVRFQGYYCGE